MFECEICTKEFVSKISRHNHIIAAHTKPKKTCSSCGKEIGKWN